MSYARNLARLSRSGIPTVDTLNDLENLMIYDGLYPPSAHIRGLDALGDGAGGMFDIGHGAAPGSYANDGKNQFTFPGSGGSAGGIRQGGVVYWAHTLGIYGEAVDPENPFKDPDADETEAIQAAIDLITSQGGGQLLFEIGRVYGFTHFKMKEGVSIASMGIFKCNDVSIMGRTSFPAAVLRRMVGATESSAIECGNDAGLCAISNLYLDLRSSPENGIWLSDYQYDADPVYVSARVLVQITNTLIIMGEYSGPNTYAAVKIERNNKGAYLREVGINGHVSTLGHPSRHENAVGYGIDTESVDCSFFRCLPWHCGTGIYEHGGSSRYYLCEPFQNRYDAMLIDGSTAPEDELRGVNVWAVDIRFNGSGRSGLVLRQATQVHMVLPEFHSNSLDEPGSDLVLDNSQRGIYMGDSFFKGSQNAESNPPDGNYLKYFIEDVGDPEQGTQSYAVFNGGMMKNSNFEDYGSDFGTGNIANPVAAAHCDFSSILSGYGPNRISYLRTDIHHNADLTNWDDVEDAPAGWRRQNGATIDKIPSDPPLTDPTARPPIGGFSSGIRIYGDPGDAGGKLGTSGILFDLDPTQYLGKTLRFAAYVRTDGSAGGNQQTMSIADFLDDPPTGDNFQGVKINLPGDGATNWYAIEHTVNQDCLTLQMRFIVDVYDTPGVQMDMDVYGVIMQVV